MTNMGILYPFLDAETINTLNAIVDDYAEKAKKILNKDYVLGMRDLLPKDSPIGSATTNWSNTFGAASTEKMCGVATITKVDTAQALLMLGWYCNADFGNDSLLYVEVNEKLKNQVDARTVYRQPGNFMLTPKRLVFVKELDVINFKLTNGLAVDIDAIVFPIAILYGDPDIIGVS